MAESQTSFYRKLLHWPVSGGREILWTCIGANAIPVMRVIGIPESVGMTAFSLSACCSILLYIIFGYLSDKCSSKMGRRRPFIITTATMVCFGTFCQWVGMDLANSGMLEKCLIYFGFMTQDLSMWAMQVPMSSYTLEVFQGREQAQVMLGNVFFVGFGGVLGFILSSQIGVILQDDTCVQKDCISLNLLYIGTAVFAVGAFCHVVSMPEKNLKQIKQEGNFEHHPFSHIITGILKSPPCLVKLSSCSFFEMFALIAHYLWYTTYYAESIYSATKEQVRLDLSLANVTLNATIIDSVFTERYDQGIREASQVMILFPISASVFSLLIQFSNIFAKLGLRLPFVFAYLFYIISAVVVIFVPHPIVFGFLASSLGYFLAIQCTVPYLLLEVYRSRQSYPKSRGLALDCSVISIFASVGQLISGFAIAQLIAWYGTSIVINHYAVAISMCGLVVAYFFVEYNPDPSTSETDNTLKEPNDSRKSSVVQQSS